MADGNRRTTCVVARPEKVRGRDKDDVDDVDDADDVDDMGVGVGVDWMWLA